MTDKSEPFDPNVGWAKNFRKFRWVYAILPALAPFGMIGVFFAGYLTVGLVALMIAGFAWFDYQKKAKTPLKVWMWRSVAIVAAPWGIYMCVLQFLPQSVA
ncbi:MAG: hypothetical protein EBY26_04985 [Microbacteriaceae bacterium]|nr:hypothetical protein [Microbacteriaceae bacterium]